MEEPGGYMPKSLEFGEEGRKKLINGIEKISNAVKSTLGPGGNTVLIESPKHTAGITVTKDGVTVAKDVDLLDPVENMAVRVMRQAAENTATSAGDGTTTSIVLAEAIAKKGMELITDDVNKTEVLRGLQKEADDIVKSLTAHSKSLTKGRLKDVATISANNDTKVGKIIAQAYKEVGKTGLVTVGKSQTSHTYSETTDGLKIERGYSSNLFINDHSKDECVFENCLILVSDATISNFTQIPIAILNEVTTQGKSLLVIAPCSENVVNTFASNVIKRGFNFCTIEPPQFGYKSNELMQDIAISVGAKYFSEKTGDDMSLMQLSDLGMASSVVIGKESTIIVRNSGGMSEEVKKKVDELRSTLDNTSKKSEKDFLLSRIASLTGGVGIIFAGGKTDLEQKELYDRIDDAVCAVRSALEEGILPGGGVALYKEALKLHDRTDIAAKILYHALMQPMLQIWKNAGVTEVPEFDTSKEYNKGYDVKNDEFGDMFKMGVIDPLKVTKNALLNGVSVAVTLLSTDSIITMARTYESAD